MLLAYCLGFSQIQLLMLISRSDVADEAEEAILEPSPESLEFIRLHGVLVAHCLMSTGSNQTTVRILNPLSRPSHPVQS